MPLNTPTVTNNNISFGPGVVYIGASGDTPTVELGAISEDGISVEISSEKRTITQGNPMLPQLIYCQAQSAVLTVSGIEWNFDNFSYGLGAGTTTVDASNETFVFGGEPAVTEVALHVQHQMGIAAQTINLYVWRAASESGFTIPFTHDEHTFEYKYSALQSTTNWASVALASGAQLMHIQRQLA
jgi:hypothetical protein